MVEILKQYPKLRGFAQHGVTFSRVASGSGEPNAVGTCPWCGRLKFCVNVETRAWDCKRGCGEGGFNKFLKMLIPLYVEAIHGEPMKALAEDRKLKGRTLRRWHVGWNGNAFTIPTYNIRKNVTDIRRYIIGRNPMSTTGAKMGMACHETGANTVWICEGEWDGMALDEALHKVGLKDAVYSTPASSFPSDMTPLFQGRIVKVVFDNDGPGIKGEHRVWNMLEGLAQSVSFVHWPEELPDKYDLRDLYNHCHQDAEETIRTLNSLLQPKPRADAEDTLETAEVELTGEGMDYADVVDGYREWLHLPNVEVLDVMFGTTFANRLDGDPLWVFLVAPPGGSKTELLMSLNEAPLIITTTSLTPPALMSGWNFGKATGAPDPSLIPKLNGKVLIIKDFTSILSMNFTARDEIFGILRDAYDGRTEKFFGSGLHRVYHSRFGIIAGVTPIIETFSATSSMLGERFIQYRIKQPGIIDVGKVIIDKALSNINRETEMRKGLLDIAQRTLDRPVDKANPPKVAEEMLVKIRKLAQWVASLRGTVSREKYTGEVQFKPTAEIGTRLAKQLCKLAMGIAMFHKSKVVKEEHYRTIVNVAKDTTPGRVENVVRQLYLHDSIKYSTTAEVANWTKFPSATVRVVLQDLALLHIVEQQAGTIGHGCWRLTRSLLKLMKNVGIYDTEEAWSKARKDAREETKTLARRKKRRQ